MIGLVKLERVQLESTVALFSGENSFTLRMVIYNALQAKAEVLDAAKFQ